MRNADENFVLADHDYCARKAQRYHIFFGNINNAASSRDDYMSADWLYKFWPSKVQLKVFVNCGRVQPGKIGEVG